MTGFYKENSLIAILHFFCFADSKCIICNIWTAKKIRGGGQNNPPPLCVYWFSSTPHRDRVEKLRIQNI